METILAKTAGFCFGVKRAVEEVLRQAEAGKAPVYTFGPIIHNDQVVNELSDKGVRVIHSMEELKTVPRGIMIIRSHGVSEQIQSEIEKAGFQVVDATCPFVKKIHRIVAEESREGKLILIAGDASHPEVEGIRGWSSGPVQIIESAEDLENISISEGQKAVLVAQTTFNYKKFEELVEILSQTGYDINVMNTVCNATEERQQEARRIASEVDAMIVIGGRHSSNSQKLYDICRRGCTNTYFIETLVDLDSKPFQSFRRVGITAGASTPKKIIEEVRNYVRTKL